jgi:hypothetical protein
MIEANALAGPTRPRLLQDRTSHIPLTVEEITFAMLQLLAKTAD